MNDDDQAASPSSPSSTPSANRPPTRASASDLASDAIDSSTTAPVFQFNHPQSRQPHNGDVDVRITQTQPHHEQQREQQQLRLNSDNVARPPTSQQGEGAESRMSARPVKRRMPHQEVTSSSYSPFAEDAEDGISPSPSPPATTTTATTATTAALSTAKSSSVGFSTPAVLKIPRTAAVVPAHKAKRLKQQPPPSSLVATQRAASPPANVFVGGLSCEKFAIGADVVVTSWLRAAPANPCIPSPDDDVSAFFGVSRPSISMRDYWLRLIKYTYCSQSVFIIALVYVDRLGQRSPRLRVNDYNVHRIISTAIMLACKMLDDRCFSNAHYARVGGVPSATEMGLLEELFLQHCEYNLFVNDRDFDVMLRAITDASSGNYEHSSSVVMEDSGPTMN